MKRFLMLCIGLLAMLSLAACGSAGSATEPAAEPVIKPVTPIPTVDAAAVSSTDFTLVGQTGRPQFLNTFATW